MAKYLDSIGLSFFWSLFKSKLLPPGGQEGQVLAKASDADDDVSWLSTGTNNIIGDHLVAASPRQIVIGQYNEADQDEHAIIVGNGSGEDDRRNVFMVDREGRIDILGSLYVKDDRFDSPASSMPNHVYRLSHAVTDGDGNVLSWLQTTEYDSGDIASTLGARKIVNGSNVDNFLRIEVHSDGTRKIYLNDQPAWRNALGLGTTAPGTILWSGRSYPTASQRMYLSRNVSTCPTGIVLHWQLYQNGEAKNIGHAYHFVPKRHVSQFPGGGCLFTIMQSAFQNVATKYVYVSDGWLTGNDDNNKSGTGASGITFKNSQWVLTQVIAV